MNEAQMKLMAGLFAGVQSALVVLGKTLAEKCGMTPAELSAVFRNSADELPQNVDSRNLIIMALTQIANGLVATQGSPTDPDPGHHLLKVIRGGKDQ